MSDLVILDEGRNLPARLEPVRTELRSESDLIDLRRLGEILFRRKYAFLAVMAAVLVVTLVVSSRLETRYTAMAEMVLEPRQDIKLPGPSQNPLPPETAFLETEVRILRSRDIALRVVKRFKLTEDPEFNPLLSDGGGSAFSPLRAVRSIVHGARGLLRGSNHAGEASPAGAPADPVLRAEAMTIPVLQGSLVVSRASQTFVLQVSVKSKSAAKAAALANAFVEEYIAAQVEQKREVTRAASKKIDDRLEALRADVEQHSREIEEFRVEAKLFDTGGVSLTEKQVAELTSKELDLKSELQLKQAAAARIRELYKNGEAEQAPEVLDSGNVRDLRARRAEVGQRQAEAAGKYGPNHPDMQRIDREMAEVERAIDAEIERIVRGVETARDVARNRLIGVQAELDKYRGELEENNKQLVRLRELERTAEASKVVYEEYLKSSKEITPQAGLEEPDARMISVADVPSAPSEPRTLLVFAVGFVLAMGAGGVAVAVMESFDRTLRSANDVERSLGQICIALIPRVPGRNGLAAIADFVIKKPKSAYAEVLRSLISHIRNVLPGETGHVVMMTSAMPREGKSTVCVSLGLVAAMRGLKTLLIDSDVRHKMRSWATEGELRQGLVDVLSGEARLDDVIHTEERTGLHFVRAAGRDDDEMTEGRWPGPNAAELFAELRNRYDLVIVDTAPALLVVQTRELAPYMNGVIMLTHFGRTTIDAGRDAIAALRRAGAQLIGAALTNVNRGRDEYVRMGLKYRYYVD